MTYTATQIQTLRDAIARGVRRVKMNGEEVEYQSLEEMRRLLSDMERAASGQRRPTHFNPAFDRGL